MNKSELAIVIILRFVGITGLFAIPAIFLPYAWMNSIHAFMGLGELPNAPIVGYLARSLSAFYAALSAFTLFISLDIRLYRSFVKLWGYVVSVLGFVLLGIDLFAPMPVAWTVGEGPPTAAVGFLVLWLQRSIATADKE